MLNAGSRQSLNVFAATGQREPSHAAHRDYMWHKILLQAGLKPDAPLTGDA